MFGSIAPPAWSFAPHMVCLFGAGEDVRSRIFTIYKNPFSQQQTAEPPYGDAGSFYKPIYRVRVKAPLDGWK